MSQHDYDIATGAGAAVRADLNSLAAAIVSKNSGATAPGTTFAYQWWADTTTGLLKLRNAANSAWITVGTLADLGMQTSAQIVAAAAGTVDAITATFTPAVPTLSNGLTLFVRAGGANTVSNPTFSPNGLTAKTIVKGANSSLVAGDIAGAGHWVELQYDATLDRWVLKNPAFGVSANVQRSYLAGMTLSTAGSSTTMSVAAGQATDSSNVANLSLSAIAKTTAGWSVGTATGGLDTGGIAASTWYYFYAIRRPDTGVVDVIFSLSASAPTLPGSYTQYRYIGAGKTNGSSQWTKFVQQGDDFYWDTPVVDYTGAGATTATTQTLTVPRKRVKAYMTAQLQNGAAYVSDLSVADLAPTVDLATSPLLSAGAAGGNIYNGSQVAVWTNTSAQIRRRESTTNTSAYATLGWMDLRGKDL